MFPFHFVTNHKHGGIYTLTSLNNAAILWTDFPIGKSMESYFFWKWALYTMIERQISFHSLLIFYHVYIHWILMDYIVYTELPMSLFWLAAEVNKIFAQLWHWQLENSCLENLQIWIPCIKMLRFWLIFKKNALYNNS